MGYAVIKKNFGKGRYTVEVTYDNSKAKTQIARLEQRKIYLQIQIELFTEQFPTFTSDQLSYIAAYITKIENGTLTEEDKTKIKGKLTSASELTTEQLDSLKAEMVTIDKNLEMLNKYGVLTAFTRDVWCADRSEKLSGKVVTLEIASDPEMGILIAPGYDGQSPYSKVNDGFLGPTYPLGINNWVMNYLAGPAVQKWRPSYRLGLIRDIDNDTDTCAVDLDIQDSSFLEGTSVNRYSRIENVAIEYMDCNSGAFVDGDHVVVKFVDFDWTDAKVIGFATDPKPCGWIEPWNGPVFTSKWPWEYEGRILYFYPDMVTVGVQSLIYNTYGANVITDGVAYIDSHEIDPEVDFPSMYLPYAYTQSYIYAPSGKNVCTEANYLYVDGQAWIDCTSALYPWWDTFIGVRFIGFKDFLEYTFTVFLAKDSDWLGTKISNAGCASGVKVATDWVENILYPRYYSRVIDNDYNRYLKLPIESVDITRVEVFITNTRAGMGILYGGSNNYLARINIPGGEVNLNHLSVV